MAQEETLEILNGKPFRSPTVPVIGQVYGCHVPNHHEMNAVNRAFGVGFDCHQ